MRESKKAFSNAGAATLLGVSSSNPDSITSERYFLNQLKPVASKLGFGTQVFAEYRDERGISGETELNIANETLGIN